MLSEIDPSFPFVLLKTVDHKTLPLLTAQTDFSTLLFIRLHFTTSEHHVFSFYQEFQISKDLSLFFLLPMVLFVLTNNLYYKNYN